MWKTKVKRISRKPCELPTTIDQKLLENVEYFNYMGSTITKYARCTREIKSKISDILRRNCLLKHVIEEKIKGRI